MGGGQVVVLQKENKVSLPENVDYWRLGRQKQQMSLVSPFPNV